MIDISVLNKARIRIRERRNALLLEAQRDLQEAKEAYKKFIRSGQVKDLKLALELFLYVIKVDRNNIESYFFLAKGFYLVDKLDKAINYARIVEDLNPNYPELKNLISVING